jgi:ubiquinone/menaquinone biosynthesis C-methylase UbiE
MTKISDNGKIDFRPKYLEDSRKFIITSRLSKFLYNFIGIKKKHSILDVGCGSGFFTREIAKHQNCDGRVIGVDINPDLILEAAKSNQQNNVEFLVGDGQSLEYPDNTFNTTICHFLLSRLPEDKSNKVISEMIRVTKENGVVAAVEPCLGAMVAQYYNDYELSMMLTTLRRAKSETQRILYNINENIGGVLFEIFTKLGLKKVSVEVLALPWWTPPPFHATNLNTDMELREWYQRRLNALEHPEDKKTTSDYGKISDAAQILRGKSKDFVSKDVFEKVGIKTELVQTVHEHRVNYLKQLLADPEDAFVNDFELIPVFAVTGRKR